MLGFAAHPRQAQAELQGGGADRALDVRAIGIFTEPCAIIDPIFRRDAAGDQRPAWPLGGLQIARQSAVMQVAVPRSGIHRRAIGAEPTRLLSSGTLRSGGPILPLPGSAPEACAAPRARRCSSSKTPPSITGIMQKVSRKSVNIYIIIAMGEGTKAGLSAFDHIIRH